MSTMALVIAYTDLPTGRRFIDVRPDYCHPAFDRATLRTRVERALVPHLHKFDTVVGTGVSGTLVLPVIAHEFNKTMVVVRQQPSSHHRGLVAGQLGERWAFIDDCCSTGTTLRRVHKAIQDVIDVHARTALDEAVRPKCVGAFLYEGMTWKGNEYEYGVWHDTDWLKQHLTSTLGDDD